MSGVGECPPNPLSSGEPVPAVGPDRPHHPGPAHDPAAPPPDDRSVHFAPSCWRSCCDCTVVRNIGQHWLYHNLSRASLRALQLSVIAASLLILLKAAVHTERSLQQSRGLKRLWQWQITEERVENGKSTPNMFIFCSEREWRQEVAGFMGNVVVIVTVHLFILLWQKLVSEGFYRGTETAESKERVN